MWRKNCASIQMIHNGWLTDISNASCYLDSKIQFWYDTYRMPCRSFLNIFLIGERWFPRPSRSPWQARCGCKYKRYNKQFHVTRSFYCISFHRWPPVKFYFKRIIKILCRCFFLITSLLTFYDDVKFFNISILLIFFKKDVLSKA